MKYCFPRLLCQTGMHFFPVSRSRISRYSSTFFRPTTESISNSKKYWTLYLLMKLMYFFRYSSKSGRRLLRVIKEKAPESSKNTRSEEHTSELQSRENLVCRLLLEKK